MGNSLSKCSVVLLALVASYFRDLSTKPTSVLAQEKTPAVETAASNAKAQATLEFEDRTYLLGENVPLYFIVKNTQTEQIKLEIGGDYRGARRRSKEDSPSQHSRVAG
jgi:hypothetical protein